MSDPDIDIVTKLSEKEIFKILNLDKFKPLRESEISFEDANTEPRLISLADKLIQNCKLPTHKHAASFSAMLYEPRSYLALILWCLVGMTNFEVIPLLGYTLLLTGAAYVVSSYAKQATYLKTQHEEDVLNDQMRLRELQFACAREYLRRNGKTAKEIPFKTKPLKERKKVQFISEALDTACVVSAVLYGAYYMAYGSVAIALKLTSVVDLLVTDIGIASALIGCLGTGGYMGYKNYKNSLNLHYTEKTIDFMNKKYKSFHEICKEIRKAKLKNAQQPIPPARGNVVEFPSTTVANNSGMTSYSNGHLTADGHPQKKSPLTRRGDTWQSKANR